MASLDAVFKFADGFSDSLSIIIRKTDDINLKLYKTNRNIKELNTCLNNTESEVIQISNAFDGLYGSLSNFARLKQNFSFLKDAIKSAENLKKKSFDINVSVSNAENKIKKSSVVIQSVVNNTKVTTINNINNSKVTTINNITAPSSEETSQNTPSDKNTWLSKFEDAAWTIGENVISDLLSDHIKKGSKGSKVFKGFNDFIKKPKINKETSNAASKASKVANISNVVGKETTNVVDEGSKPTNIANVVNKETTNAVDEGSKAANIATTVGKYSEVATDASKYAKLFSKAGKALPVLGNIVGLVGSGINIANAPEKERGRVIAGETGNWLGGLAAGAATGAGLGALGCNPLTVAIGGVAGGIAGAIGGEKAVTAIYDNKKKISNWFSNTTKNIGNGVRGGFSKVASFIGGAASAAREIGVDTTISAASKIGTIGAAGGNKIANWFSNTTKNVVNGVRGGFNKAASFVGGVASTVSKIGKTNTMGAAKTIGTVGVFGGKKIANWFDKNKKSVAIGGIGAAIGFASGGIGGAIAGASGAVGGVKAATNIYDNVSKINKRTSSALCNCHRNNRKSDEKSTLNKVKMKSEDVGRLKNKTKKNDKTRIIRLNPKITITFGDVHETADVNKIIKRLKVIMKEQIALASEGVYE